MTLSSYNYHYMLVKYSHSYNALVFLDQPLTFLGKDGNLSLFAIPTQMT